MQTGLKSELGSMSDDLTMKALSIGVQMHRRVTVIDE